MPDSPTSGVRYLTPAQVAELLHIELDEIVSLLNEGRLRGAPFGAPARWRIEEASVQSYIDEQYEHARRSALWEQSNAASFPELWGTGVIRHAD